MIKSADEEDKTLLLQLQQNNEEALGLLMKRYYCRLYDYASRFGATKTQVQDAIQEVFISLWNRRETTGSIVSLQFYLLRAVKNRTLKSLHSENRKEALHRLAQQYDFNAEFSAEDKIIQEQMSAENSHRLRNTLAQLPSRQKEIIYLKFYLQLDPVQIADIMSLSRQSVYNLLHESLQRLKNLWPVECTLFH